MALVARNEEQCPYYADGEDDAAHDDDEAPFVSPDEFQTQRKFGEQMLAPILMMNLDCLSKSVYIYPLGRRELNAELGARIHSYVPPNTNVALPRPMGPRWTSSQLPFNDYSRCNASPQFIQYFSFSVHTGNWFPHRGQDIPGGGTLLSAS